MQSTKQVFNNQKDNDCYLCARQPACYFPDDIEGGYDRSVDNFIRIYQERGVCWN